MFPFFFVASVPGKRFSWIPSRSGEVSRDPERSAKRIHWLISRLQMHHGQRLIHFGFKGMRYDEVRGEEKSTRRNVDTGNEFLLMIIWSFFVMFGL